MMSDTVMVPLVTVIRSPKLIQSSGIRCLRPGRDLSIRNGDKAFALAEQANHISQNQDPLILRTLAAAYAET